MPKKTLPKEPENPMDDVKEISNSAKTEYSKLIEYFKYLVTLTIAAISLIAGISIYFTYNNMGEMRDILQKSIDGTDKKIQENIQDNQNILKNYTDYAEKILANTQAFTVQQIDKIGEHAEISVLKTIDEKIIEEFKEPGISVKITKTGDSLLTYFINEGINKKIIEATEKINLNFAKIPNLITQTTLIANGSKKAFLYINDLSLNSKDTLIKELAKNIIKTEKEIYQENVEYNSNYFRMDSLTDEEKNFILKDRFSTVEKDTIKLIKSLKAKLNNSRPTIDILRIFLFLQLYEKNKIELVKSSIDFIEYSDNLYHMSNAFYCLQLNNYNIEMFDFDKLHEIKKELILKPK